MLPQRNGPSIELDGERTAWWVAGATPAVAAPVMTSGWVNAARFFSFQSARAVYHDGIEKAKSETDFQAFIVQAMSPACSSLLVIGDFDQISHI